MAPKTDRQLIADALALVKQGEQDRWSWSDLAAKVDDLRAFHQRLDERSRGACPSHKSLKNAASVARAWPKASRRRDTAWGVHAALCAQDDRFELIASQRWTVAEANALVRGRTERFGGPALDRDAVVWAAMQAESDEVFRAIASLHLEPGCVVADVTWGSGAFWASMPDGEFVVKKSDLSTGSDGRDLPYQDGTIDAVVVDLPYRFATVGKGPAAMDKSYTAGPKTVDEIVTLYRQVLTEAFRISKRKGIAIVKVGDTIEKNRYRSMQMEVSDDALTIGWTLVDTFIQVATENRGLIGPLWKSQHHSRRNWSAWLVFRRS